MAEKYSRPTPFSLTKKRAGRAAVLALLLLLLLAGCRRGAAEPQRGDLAVLAGSAVLVCNQECADRGQCGSSVERGQVVLLSSWGPSAEDYDMAISSDTPVMIVTRLEEIAVDVMTEQDFLLPYYMVEVPERGVGWVAGWCLRSP
jgi:hypothetical protein